MSLCPQKSNWKKRPSGIIPKRILLIQLAVSETASWVWNHTPKALAPNISHIQHSPIYVVQHSPILRSQQIWSTQKGHVQASGWIPNAPVLLRCPRSFQRNWTRCRTWLARRSSQSAVSKAGTKLSQDAKTLRTKREKDYDQCQGLSSINELQSIWKQPILSIFVGKQNITKYTAGHSWS